MKKQGKIQQLIKPALCGLCLVVTGCGAASLAQEATFESAYENVEEEEPVNIYTSAASVVVETVNEGTQSLSLYMIDRNENRTFSYDGATVVQDKYGSPMTMAQLEPGDIAEITYNSELEKLGSIALSGDAWSYEGVARYNLNAGNDSATIGDESYSIGSNVLVFSNGRPIDTDQIIHQDVLSFKGKGSNVMSITVDMGHGYLELKNADAVFGGWIEVGQTVISQIAPDMLITVPEGDYTVRLSAEGVEETREVTIRRNRETVLDLGDIEIPEPEDGIVIFEITPNTAQVYVDDESVKTEYPLRLPLGLHRITAEASGYDSLSEYIRVEPETLTVKMDLEKSETVSGNSLSSTVLENSYKGRITIEAPKDAAVYQDNLYMGIAPVTYDKTVGNHTITLRREGYITRSHDIVIADDNKDVMYAFPELEPEDESNSNSDKKNGSVSGNSVSGNSLNGNRSNGQSTENGTDSTVSGNSVSGNSLEDTSEQGEY
ncbi:MAG: PEGA domain-containing protein [Clostridium sp.]|nr:PEGA domain-containing protein [Clostridium sp.]